jgi:hypothetical protein
MQTALRLAMVALVSLTVAHAVADDTPGLPSTSASPQLTARQVADRQAAWKLVFSSAVDVPAIQKAISSSDPTVRYWGAMAIVRNVGDSVQSAELLVIATSLLDDKSVAVQIVAAEAIALSSESESGFSRLASLCKHPQEYVRIQAIAAIERLGTKAESLRETIVAATADSSEYVKRISTRTLAKLDAK